MKITAAQLTRLQTVYSQMCSHSIGHENTRKARMAWATGVLGRAVDSFSKLSLDQARILIDAAQGELGHRAPLKAGTRPNRRPVRSAEEARRAGIDGRRDGAEFAKQPEMVSAELIDTITSYSQRLGWGEAQMQTWLQSKSSPTRGRTQIRTTAEANKVIWALKGMLKDKGLWVNWSAA